jgi:hypothetical protein
MLNVRLKTEANIVMPESVKFIPDAILLPENGIVNANILVVLPILALRDTRLPVLLEKPVRALCPVLSVLTVSLVIK